VRLFIDTNVIISAILFPNSSVAEFMRYAIAWHTLVTSQYVVDELYAVFERKFPNQIETLETFLIELSYELVDIDNIEPASRDDLTFLRDQADLPIVIAAIYSHCDYLITGDKDILTLELNSPKVMSPAAFYAFDTDEN